MTRDVFGILTDGHYNEEFAMHDTGEIKVLFIIKGYLSITDGWPFSCLTKNGRKNQMRPPWNRTTLDLSGHIHYSHEPWIIKTNLLCKITLKLLP